MAKGENIYKRKDGRWEGRYIKGYDRQRKILYGYCYGHSYYEAKKKLLQAKADWLLHASERSGKTVEKSLAAYCTQWLWINESRLKKSTLAKYDSMLEKHIRPWFGEARPAEVHMDSITGFSHALLYQKKLSSKTVRDILAFLHEILLFIQNSSGIPCLTATIPYPTMEKKKLRILSQEEHRQLVAYLLQDFDNYRFAVLLALFTGLRIGEICALQWKDITVESGLLYVRQTVQRIKAANSHSSKKTVLQLTTPKTLSSVRTLPLTGELITLLKTFPATDPAAFILTGTNCPADPRTMQRRLKKYTAALKLQGVHFHTLRHTFATRCIECGCDVKTLSELLGHSNISITLNRYVHPSLELKRKNIARLEQAGFFPASFSPSADYIFAFQNTESSSLSQSI